MTALYDCCGSLSEEERKHDAGAFFKSIHGTLNHLLPGIESARPLHRQAV